MHDSPRVKLESLVRSPLFARVGRHQVSQLEGAFETVAVEKGDVLFAPDRIRGAVYVIGAGRYRVMRRQEARWTVAHVIGPGSLVADSSLDGEPLSLRAEAIEEGVAHFVPITHLRRIMVALPAVALNFVEYLDQQLQQTEHLLYAVSSHRPMGRVCNVLLELLREHGHPTMEGSIVINVPVTQTDLAEMAATSRQSVSEVLGAMREHGIISRRGRKIIVCDERMLARLALGDGLELRRHAAGAAEPLAGSR